jgi:hypothetical protein
MMTYSLTERRSISFDVPMIDSVAVDRCLIWIENLQQNKRENSQDEEKKR